MTSIRAELCDLLGYDPDGEAREEVRPTVADAVRRCPRGEVRPARDATGAEVAVVRLASGEVCVVADRCPHDGGRLSDGFVEADRLVCGRHFRSVEVRNGSCS